MRRTNVAILPAAILAAALAAGCERQEPAPAAVEQVEEIEELRVEAPGPDTLALPRAELEQARGAATALGQDLAGLVFATIEAEGTPAAVRVCSQVAQERTAAHATEGVYLRRVSDRLRNPRNQPDAAEARELERMRTLDAAGELPPEIVRLVRRGDERSLHLLRPIRVQQGCLACHGAPDDIAPEVRQILSERYPDDRAVGYAPGDLRGAISVRVPVDGGL